MAKKMKKNKKSLSLSSIRNELHIFLEKEKIVREIQDDFVEILEKNTNASLKSVKITNLYDPIIGDTNSARIWRVDLEELTNSKNQGSKNQRFSITGKTTEIALLVLTKRGVNLTLYVCLIELKSSLRPDEKNKKTWSCLDDVADKFQSSINKICLLLTLNNYDNPLQGYANQNINVIFKGLLFYNKDNIDRNSPLLQEPSESLGTNLLAILDSQNRQTISKLDISTMLYDINQIDIKFFKNPYDNENFLGSEETIEVTLEELIS
jgi:hypothetical protein